MDGTSALICLIGLVLVSVLIAWICTGADTRGPRGPTGPSGDASGGGVPIIGTVVLTQTTTQTGIVFPEPLTGASWMLCTVVGAGGAGCQPITGTVAGGGGGGGAIVFNQWLPADQTFYYKIGQGGTGGANTGFAPAGGNTIIYNDQFIPLIRAGGGQGANNASVGAGGIGGAPLPYGLNGGAGEAGGASIGGAGGGAGGSGTSSNTSAHQSGFTLFGGGDGGAADADGGEFGGGGGGGSVAIGPVFSPGGSGANGVVIVQYV